MKLLIYSQLVRRTGDDWVHNQSLTWVEGDDQVHSQSLTWVEGSLVASNATCNQMRSELHLTVGLPACVGKFLDGVGGKFTHQNQVSESQLVIRSGIRVRILVCVIKDQISVSLQFLSLLWVSITQLQGLCEPMDCSLPGSSVHGIVQARILE